MASFKSAVLSEWSSLDTTHWIASIFFILASSRRKGWLHFNYPHWCFHVVRGNLLHVVKTLCRSITPGDWPSSLFLQLANSSIFGMRGGLGGGFSLICFLLKVRSPHSCLQPLTWLPLRFLCLFGFLSISCFLSVSFIRLLLLSSPSPL